jgi:hypothetical protein
VQNRRPLPVFYPFGGCGSFPWLSRSRMRPSRPWMSSSVPWLWATSRIRDVWDTGRSIICIISGVPGQQGQSSKREGKG